jgi:hypothetical protein
MDFLALQIFIQNIQGQAGVCGGCDTLTFGKWLVN